MTVTIIKVSPTCETILSEFHDPFILQGPGISFTFLQDQGYMPKKALIFSSLDSRRAPK